jgi:EF hand domain-containing protein
MRFLCSTFVVLAVSVLAMSARADSDDKDAKKDDGGPRAEMREKILKEFDKDGDGKLSDEERDAARERMRELMGRHGERRDRGGPEGRRRHDDGRGPEGQRGPEGHGPEEHADGPPKMPKPEEMFSKFDKDKDGKLSKEEFMALADYVHEHMPPPPGAPGRSRDVIDRGGPDGPPGRRFEGHFEGHIEGRFMDGPDGPRFRGGDGPDRFYLFRDGPPPRDGEEGREMHRHDGPPGEHPEGRGDGPPRERRFFFERDGRRGPPRDRDDDDRRPAKETKDDGDKDKAESAA